MTSDRISAILRKGTPDAMTELMPLAYDEVKRIAAAQLFRERKEHTLQPTALVNEAYLRLVEEDTRDWRSRAYFFGIVGRAMRQILVDHARTKKAAKRGGGRERITMSVAAELGAPTDEQAGWDILDLDQALRELAKLDERKARVLELRYFAGLNKAEAAEVLNVSPTTVQNEWIFARAWLRTRLG